MRSTRCLTAILILAAALAAGCSERASRITGNERLLRGSDGLGTTVQYDTLVDRDTYLSPASTQVKGATLLVGSLTNGYQSRALLKPSTWTLPDTLATIDTVRFRLDFDPRVDENLLGPMSFSLYLAGATWDSTAVQWPGPPLGTLLGTGADATAPFTIDLGTSALSVFRAAAANPAFPGFILAITSGTGVRGFRAGTGRIEVVAHPSGGGAATTSVTRLPTDLSIQALPAPATGAETELVLGGLFQSGVLLRAPIAPPPAGFSINAARFITRVLAPSFPDTLEIRAYRVHNAWTEGSVPPDTSLGIDTAPLAILSSFVVHAPGDSVTIPIPIAVARAWSADSTANQGILVRITNSYYASEVRLGSRESGTPPVLRVTITSPPPGRF